MNKAVRSLVFRWRQTSEQRRFPVEKIKQENGVKRSLGWGWAVFWEAKVVREVPSKKVTIV